jgi:hypothetical protein
MWGFVNILSNSFEVDWFSMDGLFIWLWTDLVLRLALFVFVFACRVDYVFQNGCPKMNSM